MPTTSLSSKWKTLRIRVSKSICSCAKRLIGVNLLRIPLYPRPVNLIKWKGDLLKKKNRLKRERNIKNNKINKSVSI